MLNEIQIFLNHHQLNAEKVAKISGLSTKELLHLNQSFDTINLKQLQALGMMNNIPADRVLKELLEIHGHPIINFIQDHPRLDRRLVSKIENLMIDIHKDNIDMSHISFNRYYSEVYDTTENAEKCLRNLYQVMLEQKETIDNLKKHDNKA